MKFTGLLRVLLSCPLMGLALKINSSKLGEAFSSLSSSAALADALRKIEGTMTNATSPDNKMDADVPEPILPKLNDFDISMLKTPPATAATAERVDPGALVNASEDAEDDEEVDDADIASTNPTKSSVTDTMTKLAERYDAAKTLLENTASTVNYALKKMTQTLAQAEIDKEKATIEPTGVSIRLFDQVGKSDVAGPSVASQDGTNGAAKPLLRLLPENVAIPIVYTRPDTLEQMSHLMKCANDEVLQTFQMRIAEINVMFKSLMSISHIQDTIGLLQSYVRSQKDFVETAMSSLSAVVVTGATTS